MKRRPGGGCKRPASWEAPIDRRFRTYEVRISYQGVSSYFVEADDEEKATELGRTRYRNGAPEETTGSEYEEIVGVSTQLIPIVPGRPASRATSRTKEKEGKGVNAVFTALTDKLLDAVERFSSRGSSDMLWAYCTVMLDLGWQGDQASAIRDTLGKVALYAASGAIEETRIGARHIGNMVHGRAWHDGNGRAG